MKRFYAPLFAAIAAFALSGCLSATSYVDPTLGELKPADRIQVTDKRPVQFIYNFQTNGAANSNGTKQFTKKATDQVIAAGLFSEVTTTPAASGAILSITINNYGDKDAASKGFTTGLTFGLAGTTVNDYYTATAKYTAGPSAPTVTVEEKHRILTNVGATGAPQGLTASKTPMDAFETVQRQLIDHLLNDIAKDPGFKPAAKVSQASPVLAPVAG